MNMIMNMMKMLLFFYMTSVNSIPNVGELTSHDDKKCWIFMHHPKSGGTTVKEIINENFKRTSVLYDTLQYKNGKPYLEYFTNNLLNSNKWDIAIGSYTDVVQSVNAVNKKCKAFTVFRHPISRMVSAYYYCKSAIRDNLCASMFLDARSSDLLTFAKHWGNYALRQFALTFVPIENVIEYSQTESVKEFISPIEMDTVPGWYLFKMYLNHDKGYNDMDIPDASLYHMLQPVQDLLRDRYTVGILEEFNTTLSLFDTALDMPMKWTKQYETYGSKNEDKMHKDKEMASLEEAWTNSDIKKYMYLDLVLYEHAVDVFNQQVKEYGIK